MDRKEFIRQCSYACLGLVTASVVLPECTPVKYVQVKNENNVLRVAQSEFIERKNEKEHIRSYLIVKAAGMDYPIVLYRGASGNYTALLMRCTHQGSELNVHGSMLSCPAHGSEFDSRGDVLQGPAESPLTSYRVSVESSTIMIHLV